MATTRWVLGGLALGTLLLLGLQNLSPRLPLVLLGSRTLALPLGLWLVLAILLGVLTTLALNALLGPPRSSGKRRRYQYEPQPFYEPAAPEEPSDFGPRRSEYDAAPRDAAASSAAAMDSTWRDWANLSSPGQREDWGTPRPEPQRPPVAPPPPRTPQRSPLGWFGRRSEETGPDPRVQDSLRELTDDWDDVDTRRYRPAGANPVEESLEEITEGWDDLESPSEGTAAPSPYDAPKTSTQVYRDGSIYAYGYRDRAGTGQTDRIYAPSDDAYGGGYGNENYASGDYDAEDYGDETYAETDASAADLEDEGVVDADFRVIIPPAPNDPA